MLQVSRSDVEKWLKEWDITPSEKSAFLKTLVDAFSKADQQYVSHDLHSRLAYHINTSSEQRHGLLLQTCARPLARTHGAVRTARGAGRDRHGTVQSNSIRL